MAESNNFYEWLELPVERFESDPERLRKRAEEKITEWNSKSVGTKEYTRAQLYGDQIRKSIEDAAQWRRIYEEYKAETEEKIQTVLTLHSTGENSVSPSVVSTIARENGVSTAFVEEIAKKRGLSLGDEQKTAAGKQITLEQVQPENSIQLKLKSVVKNLQLLSCETIANFINAQLPDTHDSLSTPQDLIVDHLEIIKKQNKKVSPTGPLASKKTAIDTICTSMSTFFKTYSMADYIQFVKWNRIMDILRELERSKITQLNQMSFDDFIERIFEIWGNRQEAQGLLEDYCSGKQIAYPRALPNVGLCPYCNSRFTRENPIQKKCPSCGESFMVTCPKCGKEKHMIEDGICDGVVLMRYPFLKKRLDMARECMDQLALTRADSILNDIEFEWPDFPGSGVLRDRCQTESEKYGETFHRIQKLCEEKKYHEAKNQRDLILREYPQAAGLFGDIDASLASADSVWQSYETEKDSVEKRRLLLQAVELVTDDNRINTALRASAGTISLVKNLQVSVNSDTGVALLQWESENQPGSVTYRIRRKRNATISNADDGEEVGYTSDLNFSDSNALEGELLFYAVYAAVGPMSSRVCAAQEPVVYLKKMELTISVVNDTISGTWPVLTGGVQALVRYGEEPIEKLSYGKDCKNVTASGFTIEHMAYGKPCYCAVWKQMQWNGKRFLSEVYMECVTPVEAIPYPEISKTLGNKAGEYVITLLNPNPNQDMQLNFYGTEGPPNVTSNTDISVAQLQSKLQLINSTSSSDNRYAVSMVSKKTMTIYPVYVRDNTATVGRYQELRYVDSISVKNHVVSANKLVLYLDSWPESISFLRPCYSSDRFPESFSDAEVRLSTLGRTQGKQIIEIPITGNQKYYITLFTQLSGIWTPVCNYLFDHRSPSYIRYTLKKSILGMLTIELMNEVEVRPSLYLRVKPTVVPLSITDGQLVYTIPSNPKAPKKETIRIPMPAGKNLYGKLFAENNVFQLILTGSGKL